MITADIAHTFAVRARDGEDSIVGQFLEKLETKIHERSRQGMFWMYMNCDNDEFMGEFIRGASSVEVELVKMKLKHLGYAVVEYMPGSWGIAW